MAYAILFVFTTWFVLSVANQFQQGRAWIRPVKSRDVFGVIPLWLFFTADPKKSDVCLFYRDVLENGTTTAWTEIETGRRDGNRHLIQPNRRLAIAISQVKGRVEKSIKHYHPQVPVGAMMSLAYLLLLGYVMKQPGESTARFRQFLLAEDHGSLDERQVAPIVLSPFHRIDEA